MTKSKPIHILYMEDDSGLARLFQKKLERAGYAVHLARDGEEGLDMVAAGAYDVLAVDQAMPVYDGLEVIRTLASQGSLPPTIMVTGTGNEQTAVEAMKLGARDYIVKDVDGGYLGLLPTVIEQVLQQQRLAEEKQRAEETLRESEEKFRAIFSKSLDVIVIVDGESGQILSVNRAARHILGYESEALIGNHFSILFPPDPERSRKDLLEELRVHGAVFESQGFLRADGSVCPMDLTATLIPWGKGQAILATFRDVTERRQAEEERERLLAAEHEQRLLAGTLREVTLALTSHTSHEAVLDEILRQAQRIVPHSTANIALLKDDTLRIVRWRGYQVSAWKEWASDLVQPLADWPLDAQVVWSRKPLAIPDTRQEPGWVVLDETAWIRSYLSVPICLRDRVLGLLRLDGDTPGQFSAEDAARRLQPLASAAAIAIENARLVEGLEAEVAARTAEIRAEQEKSETILRSIGDAVIMTDLKMRIQYVNDAFTTLTGYTATEALGQQANTLIGEKVPEQPRQSKQLAMRESRAWQGELTIRRKDGRTYDAAMTITPMRDAAGNLVGYVSSHRDISQLKDLDRARSRFIANVSHQLRTPVTTIQLSTHLLQEGKRPEKAGDYLQMVEEETARLIHLIQDILEMTTLDSGQAVTAWETVSLFLIIENIITRYQSRAEASGLTLVAKPIPPGLPAVKGDQARLSQALGEILENAIIFTPPGGQVTVETKTVEDEGQLWVTIGVRDTGPGISPEEQEQVFDRFFRGTLAESGHVPGTGMGLSIVDEIMRAHGGRVTVESELGQGSTFTLWLRSTREK